MEGRVIFHVDFDYFYAQCEEKRRPELEDRPVCVCVFSDRGGDSGAIATANYVARKYGAKSGISISLAKRRLAGAENAEFLPVDFEYYSGVSQTAMDAMRPYADVFEYVGRDEAYLDVSVRTGGDFGRAESLARRMKKDVRGATGLSCSVGISPSRLVSKIASDYEKPDGLTVVKPDETEKFMNTIKIRDIPGIGKKTEERLAEMGMREMRDLGKLEVFDLNKEFGRKTGTYIYNASRGNDDEPVRERAPHVQYSRIITLKRDSRDYEFLSQSVAGLCADVHDAATADGVMFRTVGVHFVQSDMAVRSKSRTLKSPTSSRDELERCARQLLSEALEDQKTDVRRLGVRISELTEVRGQTDLTGYL